MLKLSARSFKQPLPVLPTPFDDEGSPHGTQNPRRDRRPRGRLGCHDPDGGGGLPPGSKDVTAVLFEWNFASVARECTTTLGPAGFGYVQVSPPAEHIQGSQWWTSYQPVSYKIAGRLGDRAAFKNMVDTCHAAGVKVVADTVINHMSAGSGTGTGGSSYTKYTYPGLYSSYDFDNCTSQINNYGDRWNVQNCELVGLADLDTGEDYVRGAIARYMNDLLSLGVDGFRIDAAKHIPAADLANIKSRLTNPSAYWKHEVIFGAGEAVQPTEYTGTGDVQEFRYAYDLKRVFNNENLAYLKNYGEGWGYLTSGSAGRLRRQPRHRAQRLHAQLQGQRHLHPGQRLHAGLALRRPGHQLRLRVHRPRRRSPNGGRVDACWQNGWKCQHNWREIRSMVGFRNATRGQAVTNWWDNGGDAIAFGRGSKGFVAINHESGSLTRTYQTSLPAGTYCDVQSDKPVTVDGSGRLTATLGSNTALAVYAGKSTC